MLAFNAGGALVPVTTVPVILCYLLAAQALAAVQGLGLAPTPFLSHFRLQNFAGAWLPLPPCGKARQAARPPGQATRSPALVVLRARP